MNKLFSKSTLLATGLLLATSANAAIVNEYWIDQELGYGAYDLINDTGVDIYGFAVGNDTAVEAFDSSGLGWDAFVFDEATWNQPYNSEVYGINTASIGLFSDLFTGYSQAVIYSYNSYYEPIALTAGATAAGFEFYTMFLSSPYVTFDINYNMIDQGMANHVPVPASVWLLISGLIGLAGISRRKA